MATTAVHKYTSVFCSDRNHRMTKTYHRDAFVDLMCFTGSRAAVLTAHGHTRYTDKPVQTSVMLDGQCYTQLEVLWVVAFELGLNVTQPTWCWILHFDMSNTSGRLLKAKGDCRHEAILVHWSRREFQGWWDNCFRAFHHRTSSGDCKGHDPYCQPLSGTMWSIPVTRQALLIVRKWDIINHSF